MKEFFGTIAGYAVYYIYIGLCNIADCLWNEETCTFCDKPVKKNKYYCNECIAKEDKRNGSIQG